MGGNVRGCARWDGVSPGICKSVSAGGVLSEGQSASINVFRRFKDPVLNSSGSCSAEGKTGNLTGGESDGDSIVGYCAAIARSWSVSHFDYKAG